MKRKPQFAEEGIKHVTIDGHRLHLRVMDPTKHNYLSIDGRILLVLDKTATDFWETIIDAMWAFRHFEGDVIKAMRESIVAKMSLKYPKVGDSRISQDLDRNFDLVMGIMKGGCPVDAGLQVKEINPMEWVAPLRMDLAVTYGCNLKCDKCYLSQKQKKEMTELPKEKWREIYKTLWSIGVFHVTFTGGEPLLRNDIIELVSEADEFVTGLITNGTLLEKYAEALRDASLDYCQVTLESYIPYVHDKITGVPDSFEKTVAGIKKALSLGMQVVTNTTLTKTNANHFFHTLEFGYRLGLKHMACNSLICSGSGIKCREANGLSMSELKDLLERAHEEAGKLGIELQWYTPTCYNELNPLDLGFGPKQCSAACYNMTVQPDGTVLPCQSWNVPVGNILADEWSKIWNNPVCKKFRSHAFAPEKCKSCKFMATCGGGCPLEK